jgi:hypothetical protein
MSDSRWLEIEADIASAADHFGRAATIYQTDGLQADTMDGYILRMAFMHAMMAGHTSLETALVRTLELQGEDPAQGRQWHADLRRRAGRATERRPAILPPDLVRAADRTRRFRHIAVHAYGAWFGISGVGGCGPARAVYIV